MTRNKQLVQVVEEACHMVPELAILAEEPAEVHILRLVAGLHEVKEEMAKVQLELNLYIIELQLKVQPSIPPEVKEQRINAITVGITDISSAVKDCTKLFKESFEFLTTLQDDPNIQCLET